MAVVVPLPYSVRCGVCCVLCAVLSCADMWLHTGWQDSQEWIVFYFNFMHMFICIFGCDICSYSMQIWTFHISRGCCCCFVYSYIILECPMMLILDFWCYMQCTDCCLLCFCFWWYTYSLVSFRLIRFLVVFVSHWWWLFITESGLCR